MAVFSPAHPGAPRRTVPRFGRSRVYGAMNKERHVCARRRVGEPAVLDGEGGIPSYPPAPEPCRDRLFSRVRYVEPVSAARTKLEDCFNILLRRDCYD